jgi:hypothetical protein
LAVIFTQKGLAEASISIFRNVNNRKTTKATNNQPNIGTLQNGDIDLRADIR